ncbi:MAG TPA: flagellar hook basal-body protein, partial [Xanthobacteraceae bacterium]|nr:flagellar hook basal-body protein [Xanthobacteraceae bacterium]
MGIFGALTTAVTGLQAQSFALQNISGNIANASTVGYKEVNTSFEDMIASQAAPSAQVAGTVTASSVATNSVQGDFETESIGTYMAINGAGYFVVQQPQSFTGSGTPQFSGNDVYTRRGDFQTNAQGYLVNGAGYYLMGIPIDSTTGNLA